MFIVERFGRRKILLMSIAGVFIALVLMGGGFLAINKDSADTLPNPNSSLFDIRAKNYDACRKYKNCDYCVTDERCGFCSPVDQTSGYCLPAPGHNSDIKSSTGFCNTSSLNNYHYINLTKYEWADVYCHTKFTAWPIIVMVIYLGFFGAGYAPMTWVLNSEFYPLWARGTCMAISTFCNWEFNLLVSLTFLSLSEEITKFGAFFLYAGITFIALILFSIFVPETKGLELDEVEMLFMTKKEREKRENVNND